MAVALKFRRRIEDEEPEVTAAALLNRPMKCAIRRLVVAQELIAILPPPLLLPIRNLLPLHFDGGALPPRKHPRNEFADGRGSRPVAEISYAHCCNPTSAL